MELVTGNIGWIEVICGPMFSGKSEELIRRLRRARIARKRVQVFKPALDNRYSADEIVSHGDQRMDSEVVSNAKEMLTKLDWRTQVIGVDESNFFGPDLVDITAQLADTGKQVIIAGLDTDFLGRPFSPMPELTVFGRVHHQDPGHLHALRQSRQTYPAPGRIRRLDRSGSRRHVRSPLPPLLRARRSQTRNPRFRPPRAHPPPARDDECSKHCCRPM